MKFREEIIGDCRLILGDCRDVLPMIGRVDAVVTDPPYGVFLGEIKNGQSIEKEQKPYESFSDSPKYISSCVVPLIKKCVSISKRTVVTCGNRNMWMYPQPDDMGVWYNPAGTSRGKWGFSLVVTPILYYGKDPYFCTKPSSVWAHSDSVSDIKNKEHPCPKPLSFTKWLVDRASLKNEVVFDPFMGSGTTGVACVKLGRKFIGIELEEKYFDIACKRIEQATRQPDMFINQVKPVQEKLFDEKAAK